MGLTAGNAPTAPDQTRTTMGYAPGVGPVPMQMGTPTADPAPGAGQQQSAPASVNISQVTGQPVSNNNPVPIGHASAGLVNDPLAVAQSAVQTGFDGIPQSGVPAGSQQLISPFSTTISASIAVGSQVVTPAAMSGTNRGAAWSIQVGSYLTIANSNGSNSEKTRVTAAVGGTFTATFASTKTGPGITVNGEVLNQAKDATVANPTGAGSSYSATQLWNKVTGAWEDELSIAGENSGATGGGGAVAAEVEFVSGGPPLANGLPSLLQYDREVAALGKVICNAGLGFAITSTTANDTILTPTTPANYKSLTVGSWIRLSGGAIAENVRVADTYVPSIAPATIPLTSPVVNTGQTLAMWDTFGVNGPGQGPVMWTGEGYEGVLLGDPTKPGFGRVLQGNTVGEATVTNGGLSTTPIAASNASDTVIKATPGRIARVLVTVTGTNPMQIFDNAAGHTGTIIGALPASPAIGSVYDFQLPAALGITVFGNAANPGVTISWS